MTFFALQLSRAGSMPALEITIPAAAEPEAERIAALLSARLGEETPVAWSEAVSGWVVSAYVEGEIAPTEAAIRDALGGDGFGLALRVTELADDDWVRKSLEGLPVVRAGRFRIHGSHDRDRRRASDIAIEIEAGLAFGTGHHGTTAGCLLALERVFRRRHFRNALDLGTGSGVLAIALAKRWRVPVLATDIDPVAARVARDNARLNGVTGLVEIAAAPGFRHPAFAQRQPFDLIVANILAEPLVALAPALVRQLAPGGAVILSGLLPWQGRRIVAAYRNQGLALVRSSIRDTWLTLELTDRR